MFKMITWCVATSVMMALVVVTLVLFNFFMSCSLVSWDFNRISVRLWLLSLEKKAYFYTPYFMQVEEIILQQINGNEKCVH